MNNTLTRTAILCFIVSLFNSCNLKEKEGNREKVFNSVSQDKGNKSKEVLDKGYEEKNDSLRKSVLNSSKNDILKLEENERLKQKIGDSIYLIERFDDVSNEVFAILITKDGIEEFLLASEFDGSEEEESYDYVSYKVIRDSIYVVSNISNIENKYKETIVERIIINENGIKLLDLDKE